VCVQKKFVMYRNIGVQRKVLLVNGNGCIVFVNIKMKQKEKERKTSKVDMFIVIGSINHS